MLRGTGAIFAALGGYFGRTGLLTLINAVTVLYSLPLVVIAFIGALFLHQILLAPFGVALLLGVLPNPAAAGLHYCARLRAKDEPIVFADLRDGLSEYWRAAVPLFGAGIALLAIILINVAFYGAMRGTIARLLEFVWLYIFMLWAGIHLYVYPLLFAVEERSVLLIHRNAAVLAVRRPVPTLLVGLVWLGWLVLSSVVGIVVLAGLVVAALLQQNVFVRLLPTFASTR